MYKIVILPLAKEDISRIAKWYNKRQKGLGKRFTQEVRKKMAHVRRNPENIVVRYRNVQTAIVKVFPYMIHFTVDEATKTITVLAVFAMSQSPQKWDDREEG